MIDMISIIVPPICTNHMGRETVLEDNIQPLTSMRRTSWQRWLWHLKPAYKLN